MIYIVVVKFFRSSLEQMARGVPNAYVRTTLFIIIIIDCYCHNLLLTSFSFIIIITLHPRRRKWKKSSFRVKHANTFRLLLIYAAFFSLHGYTLVRRFHYEWRNTRAYVYINERIKKEDIIVHWRGDAVKFAVSV